jgi:Carbohydrate-selective porin, OprB family/S-layer homology domain
MMKQMRSMQQLVNLGALGALGVVTIATPAQAEENYQVETVSPESVEVVNPATVRAIAQVPDRVAISTPEVFPAEVQRSVTPVPTLATTVGIAVPPVAPIVIPIASVTPVSQLVQADELAQVTSVSQLSDVRPTDWAYQSLQSLVERYGCIEGYPDKAFRGNRAMTRYEFAAGLNACVDRVNDLIVASTANLVRKEDLVQIRTLQEQFAAELATLRGRTDALESKTATLEKQQFSTTTKLSGEAIFGLSQEFNRPGNQAVLQDRVRLSLNTSFTGKDLLVTRLAAGNARPFNTAGINANGDSDGLQTINYGGSETYNNNVSIDKLAYYTSLGDKLNMVIPAWNGQHYDYAPTMNPALDSGDSGNTTISMFGQRNPIYSIGGGSGLGANYSLGGGFQVSAGYLAKTAANPTAGNGLFNGDSSLLAQVSYAPPKSPFQVALTYVNAYKKSGAVFDGGAGIQGSIGTAIANNALNVGDGNAIVNAYGISAAYQVNPKFVLSAFGTYATADFKVAGSESATIATYGLGAAFPDFGKKGNLLGLVVGVEPYATNANQSLGPGLNSAPVHVEAFYKYQVNDRISVTPGVVWVTNPGQIEGNPSALIGTLRTTFTF